MKYKITPLNVLVIIFIMIAIYDYTTMANDDGLGGTTFMMAMGGAFLVLAVDLGIQKIIKNYKWVIIIETILAACLLLWTSGGVFF